MYVCAFPESQCAPPPPADLSCSSCLHPGWIPAPRLDPCTRAGSRHPGWIPAVKEALSSGASLEGAPLTVLARTRLFYVHNLVFFKKKKKGGSQGSFRPHHTWICLLGTKGTFMQMLQHAPFGQTPKKHVLHRDRLTKVSFLSVLTKLYAPLTCTPLALAASDWALSAPGPLRGGALRVFRAIFTWAASRAFIPQSKH